MADGPVANLPAGFDAYAGYVNDSGIGQTYPAVVRKFPHALHLSITTDHDPAQCADVEKGAMSDWSGYAYGYCSVSNVNALVAQFGRPKKLWTAHHSDVAHICSPVCWPGLVTTADATQWTNHGNTYDESLLAADFFDVAPHPAPLPGEDDQLMQTTELSDGRLVTPAIGGGSRAGQLLLFFTNKDGTAPSVIDVTDEIGGTDPYSVTA